MGRTRRGEMRGEEGHEERREVEKGGVEGTEEKRGRRGEEGGRKAEREVKRGGEERLVEGRREGREERRGEHVCVHA